LALAGCRTQPYVNAHIESVNAEYRQLEDYVYALEDENARLQQEIDGLRTVSTPSATPSGPASPSRGGLFRRSPALAPPRRSPAAEPAPGIDAPVIEVPGSTPPAPARGGRSTLQRPLPDSPELTAPSDTPPSVELPARPRRNDNPASEEVLPVPTAPHGDPTPAAPERIPARPTDKKITHLFLNPLLTTGADFDGQPGDDGLRIVVEPRNAGDQFVPEAGALSVVLLDPDRQGEAARVARWDFDKSATRQMLAASAPGRGIKLEIHWPATAPEANRLKLFVRYETPDGRRVQANREIFITPPGQAISRWTPRPADRQRSAAEATVAASQPIAETPAPTATNASAATAQRPRSVWSPNR